MLRRSSFLLALAGAILPSLWAATPARYDVEAVVATVAREGRDPFGSKFFFTAGDQVIYRVLPPNRSDADPAPSWSYWSPASRATVLPVAGYESVDVAALGPAGVAIGRSVTENSPTPNPHQETAFFWTAAAGSAIPPGFDAGASGLRVINAAGRAAGFTNGGTYRTVLWDAATPAAGVTEIVPPSGYGNCEARGVSAAGETLLYVSNPGQNVAIWSGTSSVVVGPSPNSDETFYPSNCAMNAAGDIAMVFFNASGYRLVFIPAATRPAYQVFSFNGSGDSVYHLQVSDAGLASCETSVNGTNVVSLVSTSRAQQLTFAGYNAFLNAAGELVYGNGGVLHYWDAAAWAGAPAAVPLSLPTTATIAGFSDTGRLLALADNASQTTRTLSILAPVRLSPAPVTLTPVRQPLRLTTGKSVRQRLARTQISGGSPTGLRYILRGKVPRGLRFRAADGFFVGRPTRVQRTTVRVAATYASAGVAGRSAFLAIRVVVRAPTSLPAR